MVKLIDNLVEVIKLKPILGKKTRIRRHRHHGRGGKVGGVVCNVCGNLIPMSAVGTKTMGLFELYNPKRNEIYPIHSTCYDSIRDRVRRNYYGGRGEDPKCPICKQPMRFMEGERTTAGDPTALFFICLNTHVLPKESPAQARHVVLEPSEI